jgi:hypothetical protein
MIALVRRAAMEEEALPTHTARPSVSRGQRFVGGRVAVAAVVEE